MQINNVYTMRNIALYKLLKIFIFFICCTIISCTDKESISPQKEDFYSEGSVIFWTSNSTYGTIDVYIDGAFVGTITTYTFSDPECGTYGFVTIKRPPGSSRFNPSILSTSVLFSAR